MTSPTISPSRRWGTLVIACLAILLLSVDLTVLHLAAPRLAEDMRPSATQFLWIADVYGFALAGLLVTMGNIGDRIGRRRLLLFGMAAFGAASALTAYAPTPAWLIAARALLGVAGATIMPSTLSIIRNVFTDTRERATAVGVWSSVSALGFAVGPLAGGLLLDHFWWGSVFLINVPVAALVVVAGAFVLPESRNPRPGRIDAMSVALSAAGVVAVIYALKTAAHDGVTGAEVWGAGAFGAAALILFVRRQTRLAEPLIDVRLFRRRAFSGAIGANMIGVFAMLASSLTFAQYFQLVRGWSPLVSGLASLPGGLGAALGGTLASGLVMTVGRARVAALGLAMTAAGFLMYGRMDAGTGYAYLLAAMLVASTGTGLAFTVTNDTVLASVPRERAGAASAIAETAQEMGGALGIAVLGSVLNSVYRGRLELPSGVPPEAARQIGESLGGALETAAALPPALAGAVTGAARRTFVTAMQLTVLTAAALLALLAVAVLFALRGVPKVIPEVVLDDRGGAHPGGPEYEGRSYRSPA
ncbi:MFS transporter [Streptosporangium sandarakinum]|uniref:DHA2 family multidrug resistance protein-like MFS transporter n=1 Tax=Streptosporangium sandarakinum TaxID=1260955 RepID=A0A852UZW4_9ACTN|nr:MFS transporter [Streptosporangium sandarakinum]NYF41226.1 DHA2 family multidrug resistance protein-like MFS transporter [Streptosporangium sandarakinum]